MLSTILLQAVDAQPAQGGSAWGTIIMMVLIFVVFYLFMIRPQTKKQKEIQKQRDGLKAGDKVVTAGGIHGKIKDIQDTTFSIEIADGVRIKVDKASVYAVEEPVKKDDKAKDEKAKDDKK